MTSVNRATLYTYFMTGDKPTQAQFANLIDSNLNLSTTSAQSIMSDVSALGKLDISGNLTVLGSAATSLTGNVSVSGLITGDTATQAITDNSLKLANTAFVKQLSSPITNSLTVDVALNNTGLYFDGPSVAQGTSGTWFVSGSVKCIDTAGTANFLCKLWDGNTIIATAQFGNAAINTAQSIAMSGYITNPTGNLRISVNDGQSTSGSILANIDGNGKNSTITAIRIA